ncbi:MAG: recombinase family protein [Magnetococcales bacterium]|nr:recombinase family protein [Magnetococcales bacterium]
MSRKPNQHISNTQTTGDGVLPKMSLKQAFAATYSREHSARVSKGQCRLIQQGFHHGGVAGFGLRRMIVDAEGRHIRILEHGEQKRNRNGRVILVHGPEDELKIVRWIFEQFVKQGKKESEIAKMLNDRMALKKGDQNQQVHPTTPMRPWNAWHVKQILASEKYIGNITSNRKSNRSDHDVSCAEQTQLLRFNDALDAIVSKNIFRMAQRILHERSTRNNSSRPGCSKEHGAIDYDES